MRTLLRDTRRGMYYRGGGRWTIDYHRALDFELIDQAIRHVEKAGLREVELVFAFKNPPALTPVPLARLAARYADEAA